MKIAYSNIIVLIYVIACFVVLIETTLNRICQVKQIHRQFIFMYQFVFFNEYFMFIKNTDYEDEKALKNPKYKDRAGKRREQIGSEGAFQRDDAPASVHS